MVKGLLLGAVFILGCGAPQSQSQGVMHSVRGYNDALRWARLPTAAGFIAMAEREAFLDEREELAAELRIDYYEVARMRLSGRNRAEVQIRYTWHMDDVGVVNDTTVVQRWERHGKLWVMAEEHRMRGEAMPGIAEPPENQPEMAQDEAGDEPG